MSITDNKKHITIDIIDMVIILILLFLIFASHMTDYFKKVVYKSDYLEEVKKNKIILEKNNNLIKQNDNINNVSNNKPYK
jgi:hypothetical protein